MRLLLLTLFVLFALACNNNKPAPSGENANTAPASQGSIPPTNSLPASPAGKISDSIPFNIQIDTVIHFAFVPGSDEITVKGSLDRQSHPVIGYLPVTHRKKLDARIIPEDNQLNIRFSQIILPDKTSDGPFGREMKYTLDQTGTYKLIIAPSNMAEGKRSGDFQIKLIAKDY